MLFRRIQDKNARLLYVYHYWEICTLCVGINLLNNLIIFFKFFTSSFSEILLFKQTLTIGSRTLCYIIYLSELLLNTQHFRDLIKSVHSDIFSKNVHIFFFLQVRCNIKLLEKMLMVRRIEIIRILSVILIIS